MRTLSDFQVAVVDSNENIYIVEGERDTINATDTTFQEAYIPLQKGWEDESHLYSMPLHTQLSEERSMGPELLIYGSMEFSDPESDRTARVVFDFREYPSGTFDLFELELSDDVWHVEFNNLEGQVQHRIS